MKTTTIHKPRPTKNFTTFHNEMLQDERISFASLGILAMMLSRPMDWTTRVEWLYKQRREGKRAIQICLQELESLGYLSRSKGRSEDGRIAPMIWRWEGTPAEAWPSAGRTSAGGLTPTKDRVYKAGGSGCVAGAGGREGTKKRKGGFVPQHTRLVVKRLPQYPQTIEEFEELLQTYGLDHDPDHDGNFWEEFTKRGWKMPDGSPVKDVGKLYESRLDHCESY